MEIKKIETVVLSTHERTFLATLAESLDSICGNMICGAFECGDCPLNGLTDKAHDLSMEISEFLTKSR